MINKALAKFKKIRFCFNITAGLYSFMNLVWQSRKLRWSRTGFLKPPHYAAPVCINLKLQGVVKPLFLRTYEGDIDIFYEVFFRKIYAIKLDEPGKVLTIIDAGANIGLTALFFRQQYPNAHIICVEPDTSNYQLLNKNLETEIHKGRVSLVHAAVLDKPGECFLEPGKYKYNSRVAKDTAGAYAVAACSMNDLLETYKLQQVDILKMDIEGAEMRVFSGDLQWLSGVKNIIIEFHGDETRAFCSRIMKEHGFAIEKMEHGLYRAKR